MSNEVTNLQAIDVSKLPEYPISCDNRLDSHFFIPWNLKRWRKSKFRQLADPEVGWVGFLLICEAHGETPVGTLPNDERLLSKSGRGSSRSLAATLQTRNVSPAQLDACSL